MTDESPQMASKLPWLVVGALGCGTLVVVLILGGGLLAYLFLEAKQPPVAPPQVAPPVAPPQPVGPAPVAPAPVAPTPVAPVAPGAPKPGYARGCVRGEDGRPIKIPGAKVSVGVGGTAFKSGEHVDFYPVVHPDGTYEVRIPDGRYGVNASLTLTFQGKPYEFYLDPADGDREHDQASETGVVKDFVWKTTGPRKPHADARNFTDWHGASLKLTFAGWREDLKKPVKAPSPETVCTFSLVPRGPRIDGSAGKTLTFEQTYGSLVKADGNIPDLPIGDYTLTATETLPDGAHRPFLLALGSSKYAESCGVTFEPGSSIGPWPCSVSFTRPE